MSDKGFTYLSRKDVSLHSAFQVHASNKTPTEIFFRFWTSRGLRPMGADTGVEDRSELTDVRSVLRSNDVQEESEETELVSTHSSRQPCLRSMVTGRKQESRDKVRQWRWVQVFKKSRVKRWAHQRVDQISFPIKVKHWKMYKNC